VAQFTAGSQVAAMTYNGLHRKRNKPQKSKAPFVQIKRSLKRSKAYHGLSVYARAALIELLDRFNGSNNGRIGLGVRELAYELNCGKTAATDALSELDDAKLAHPAKVGAWRGKQASEWRLTFLPCPDGDLPTTNWEQRKPYDGVERGAPRPKRPPLTDAERAKRYRERHENRHDETATRDTKGRQEEHRRDVRPPGGTQEAKNSMNSSRPRPPRGTHLDIYPTKAKGEVH
jgi:hypothetical protein